MKIVILNECFFDKDQIKRIENLGEVSIYDDTDSGNKTMERLKDADIAIGDCFTSTFNKKVLNSLEKLKFLAINSTGFDRVDLVAANKNDIKVANVPNFSSEAVAEHVIALMLAVIRKIPLGDKENRRKFFHVDPADKEHKKYLGFNVEGKTLGIIGFGNIGERLSELAMGLGMKVVSYNRSQKQKKGVTFLSLEETLKSSDVVSLNLALTDETKHIIKKKELKLMKPASIIVNAGRGELIDTEALYESLKKGEIFGAGVDITDAAPSHGIFKLDNIIFSPHSAWFTKESLKNMAEIITKNVEAFVKGKPINLVS